MLAVLSTTFLPPFREKKISLTPAYKSNTQNIKLYSNTSKGKLKIGT